VPWTQALARVYRHQRDRLLLFLTDVADWLTALERHAGLKSLRLPPTLPEALAILRLRLLRLERWMRAATPRAPGSGASVERLCDWPPCARHFPISAHQSRGQLTCSPTCRRLRRQWLVRNRERAFGPAIEGGPPRVLRLRSLAHFDAER